ncbi:amidase [Arboricoccus pini]|uniref:Amidase n=1 Tax=Arboricoccus pini TaxID=1963835 RepID=A0A212RH65_9PROT|nr:acetamidase/formamidase family protein [Arboricoccus pini]SNB71594.1 amidase [Arboricoccus pini]
MCVACQHTIHKAQGHLGWNNAFEPALRVAPGQTCFFECRDASNGQLTPTSRVADVGTLDFGQVNPVTGPVHVDGAEPGDALKVTIHQFEASGFGWTANIPGFGILADQFKEAALALWSYDKTGQAPAAYGKSAKVPLKPMVGTIGNAPAAPGLHSIIPPRRVGGNMDIRDIGTGTELWLPVEVEGALFSLGDCHAAQGDGEVCGTAIETSMSVAVTIDLVKDANLATPRFTTKGPVTRHLDEAGYEVTTGVGPDLMAGARDAVARMVDLLTAEHGMAPEEAYMLCSVCADLRISEIVNQPNWVVAFYFPRIVFA